jgi:hypothetical protein
VLLEAHARLQVEEGRNLPAVEQSASPPSGDSKFSSPSLLNQKRFRSPPRQPRKSQRIVFTPPARWYSNKSKSLNV